MLMNRCGDEERAGGMKAGLCVTSMHPYINALCYVHPYINALCYVHAYINALCYTLVVEM